MTAPTIDDLLKKARELPTLPKSINYLLDRIKNDSEDINKLVLHIEQNSEIVSRILTVANSVISGLSTKVTSVKQAMLVMGMERIVSTVLAGVASSMTSHYKIRYPGFDARWIWEHAIGVAICADVLSRKIPLPVQPTLAFTCGLLHDTGQMLMFIADPSTYLRCLGERDRRALPLPLVEQEIYGYDHGQAGKVLTDTWRLPEELGRAIETHHNPDDSEEVLGSLIHICEVISHALDLGERDNNRVPDLSSKAYEKLGIDWQRLSAFFPEIEARFKGMQIALGT